MKSRYGCFRKWWYPQIIHFNRDFHYKSSILGYPYLGNTHIPPDCGWRDGYQVQTKCPAFKIGSWQTSSTEIHTAKLTIMHQTKNTNLKKHAIWYLFFQNILCIQWKLRLKKLDMKIICPTWENMQSSFKKMGWSCGRITIWQLCFSVSTVNFLNYFELPKIKSIRSERSRPLCNDPCSITAKQCAKEMHRINFHIFFLTQPSKVTL